QTLDFRPYRVDLTPFAAVLADGNPHVLGISVYNVDSYFLATANLLLYTDHGARRVTGGLLSSTLSAAPAPVVAEHIQVNPSGPTYTTTSEQGDSEQGDLVRESASGGSQVHDSSLENEVRATDTLNFDAAGNFLGPSGSMTTQRYRSQDSSGGCYSRTLKAQAKK